MKYDDNWFRRHRLEMLPPEHPDYDEWLDARNKYLNIKGQSKWKDVLGSVLMKIITAFQLFMIACIVFAAGSFVYVVIKNLINAFK